MSKGGQKGRHWKLSANHSLICQYCGIEFLSKLKTNSKWCSNKCKAQVHLTPAKTRKYRLKNKYGLTETIFNIMLNQQDSKCGICREVMEQPHIDHDHKTGRVRGLLCTHCNTMLGMARDSTFTLRNAISYLENNS